MRCHGPGAKGVYPIAGSGMGCAGGASTASLYVVTNRPISTRPAGPAALFSHPEQRRRRWSFDTRPLSRALLRMRGEPERRVVRSVIPDTPPAERHRAGDRPSFR